MNPINVTLFSLLERTFGSVKIAKAGEPFRYNAGEFAGSPYLEILDYGETYRICCPFCAKRGDADRRYRLWISHVWGCYLPELDKRLWAAAKCFHNDCLSDWNVLSSLIDSVFISNYDISTHNFVYDKQSDNIQLPPLPGDCIPLKELDSSHKAIKFLRERGFDPAHLQDNFGVCYCYDSSQYPYAIDKLVFPIDFNGQRVGWQCRYIGTPPGKMPKYFSAPGMSIKRYIYNYDKAKLSNVGILVEGVFDAARIGYAGALFGKTLSLQQLTLISLAWDRCIVFLDPDAADSAEKIANTLRSNNIRVVCVKGHPADPGKLTKEVCDGLIKQAMASF